MAQVIHNSFTSSSNSNSFADNNEEFTKYSGHHRASLNGQLHSTRDAIDNFKYLISLLSGEAIAPNDLISAFEKVFDEEVTAISQSEGLKERNYDELVVETVESIGKVTAVELLDIDIHNPPYSILYSLRAYNLEMDVTWKSIAYIKNGKIARLERQETRYALGPLIKNYQAYFGLFDGEKRVPSNLRSYLNAVYDKSVRFARPRRFLDFEETYKATKKALKQGGKAEVIRMSPHELGIEYHVRFIMPSKVVMVHSVAVVENGKIIRTQPMQPTKYHLTASLNKQTFENEFANTVETMKKLRVMLEACQGQGTLPEDFDAKFEGLYSKDIVGIFDTTLSREGPRSMNYDQLRGEVTDLFKLGYTARVLSMERRAPGIIRYVVHVCNKDTDAIIRSIGYVRDGKMFRFERQGCHYSIFPLIKSLREYFSLYTGERRVPENLQSYVNAVFDRSLVFETPSGEVGYNEVVASLPPLFQQGLRVDVLEIARNVRGLEYELRVTMTEYTAIVRTFALVQNGRIVRMEPQENKEVYDWIFHGKKAYEKEEYEQVVHNMQLYFDAYIGNGEVPTDLDKLIDAYYDESLIMVTPAGEIPFNEVRKQVFNLHRAGLKTELITTEPHPRGVVYQVRTVTPIFDWTVRALAVIRNGKVIRVEPQENAEYFNIYFPVRD